MSTYRPVNSLKRGLTIFEAFTTEHPTLRLQEIAKKTGLPKSTVLRLLQTLISLHYVSFDSDRKQYSLTPKIMSLGLTVISNMELRKIALPHLVELSRLSDQTVNLGILDRTEVVYIERISKRRVINTDFHIGSRLNSYQSSIGRAILAFLKPEKLDFVLDELLRNPEAVKQIGANGESLKKILAQVRRNGYAINDEELFKGLRAIGAPVFNANGEVTAAVNIPVFSPLVSRKELVENYVPLLLQAAEKISNDLGFVRNSNETSFTFRLKGGKSIRSVTPYERI